MTVSIGVVFGSMDQKTIEILSYLITYQNTLQNSFEFHLISYSEEHDPLLNLLQQKPAPVHYDVATRGDEFAARVNACSATAASSYGLPTKQIDKIVLLTNTRFRDNYYYIGMPTWAVIALGDWQKELAPPSLVEYYLNILVTSALDALGAGIERHFLTRGCVFDFNASLDHKRLSVLSGNICSDCAAKIEAKAGAEFVLSALILLKRDWLGDSNSPSAVASTVKKLGFDLFHTTGAKPTFRERVLASFEQEGLKNLLHFTFQLLLAIALVMIGLKK